jgi:hypothetical protein
MDKFVSAKGKVLRSLGPENYELGFRCPDCESGWVTMAYNTKDTLVEGTLIDIKIGKITRGETLKIEPYIEPSPDADWMPAIMILAREAGIVEEDVSLATKIQSLRFDNKKFTKEQAVKWAADHNFKHDDVVETENQFRLRQFPPEECTGSGGMKELTDGVSAYICPVAASAKETELAEWTTAYINELPDSSFAYVEPCYGKTTDNKNARHLPYKDKDGTVDLPHLRNALARVNQIKLICDGDVQAAIAHARGKLEAAAKAAGVGKYTVIQTIQSGMFKIKENETGKIFIGLTDKEMAADTLADIDSFSKVTEETQMADFTLIHHWWGNGELYEHYDLFINTSPQTHIVLGKNPMKETEFKAVQRKPYTEDFWQKGTILEQIAPGQPGNPSDDIPCSIERVDMGKVAIYENAQQINNDWLARMEFFGSKLEGRWSFTSSVPNIWNTLKETTKLTDIFSLDIRLNGNVGAWKETPEGLVVEGKALSFGVWNGMYWSPEVIKDSPISDFDNMIIDVEHRNNQKAGKILEKSLVGADINVKFLIDDYETAQKIKDGEYKGLSIDAIVFGDPIRRVITGVKQYKRLTVCHSPACKTCLIGSCVI